MSNKVMSVSKVLMTYPQCDKDKEWLVERLESNNNLLYWVVSKEPHEETEGEHLHAFIVLRTAVKMRSIAFQGHFDYDGYHPNLELVKHSKADILRVWDYVTKHGDYISNVERSTLEGKRQGDPASAKELLTKKPTTLVEEGKLSPYQYTNICKAQLLYKNSIQPDDCTHCRGIWLYGPAGVGKSTVARVFGKLVGGIYYKQLNKWWDGYEGEPCVILDEYDNGALNHYLKMWTDSFAYKGEVKGSSVWLHHSFFIVTSNSTLESVCDQNPLGNADVLVSALKRRMCTVYHWDLGHQYFDLEDIFRALVKWDRKAFDDACACMEPEEGHKWNQWAKDNAETTDDTHEE